MASIAMLVGGAFVNALAFSGSNFLFSRLQSSHSKAIDKERKRHDQAMEQLQAAHARWSQKRTERLDWINEELRRQSHAVHTFQDVDTAIHEYAAAFPQKSKMLDTLGPEPTIADFYKPSNDQKDREIVFVILGMGVTALVAYQLVQ